MARRLGNVIKANIYVAITGLIMPGGSENPDKPVGTMFIHVIINQKPIAVKEKFEGSPEEIVLQTVDHVAQLLIDSVGR
jgi:nicotinamide-nucleotide amidase